MKHKFFSRSHAVFPCATIIVAFTFAAATLYPHVLQLRDEIYPYQGIELMATDAEQHYAARVREIVDGHFATANVFYHEPKHQPYLLPPVPEAAVAIPALLLRIDPIFFFVLSKGVSAFALTLLFVGFFTYLTKRRWESLLAVTVLLFAGALLGAPWDFIRFFSGNLEYDFLRFVRPINPLWSTPWFFAAIGFLACWIEKRATWKIVLSSLCTVVTLYSYFYAWSYIGAVMMLLTFWYAWKRDFVRMRDLMIFLGIFLLLGIPYFWNLWHTMHHPDYLETSKRLGMALRRTPVLGWWTVLLTVIAFASKRLWPATWPLLPALALAGILVLNQQVLTGRYLVPHHYHWYFVFPIASVCFLILILQYGSQFLPGRILRVAGTIFLICIACVTGFLQQTRAYDAVREEWGKMQEWRSVIDALAADGQPGDTIFASKMRLADLVTVYTSLDAYAASDANHYLVSKKRAEDVLFFRFWFQGLRPIEANERFYTDLRSELSTRIYAIYYREAEDDYLALPDDVIAEHAAAYETFFALSPEEKLSMYPLEYVVVMPEDPQTPAIQALKDRSETIFQESGYEILKLRY